MRVTDNHNDYNAVILVIFSAINCPVNPDPKSLSDSLDVSEYDTLTEG